MECRLTALYKFVICDQTIDFTYIWTEEGWLYLAVVLDLYSRAVVGWAMAERMTRELAMSALTMAVWRRRPEPGVVAHSDRGSQYASGDYRALLETHGFLCSMRSISTASALKAVCFSTSRGMVVRAGGPVAWRAIRHRAPRKTEVMGQYRT